MIRLSLRNEYQSMPVHAVAVLVGMLAPTSSGIDPSELGSKIDALIQPYVDIGDFSGVVLVAEKGEVLYERG
ncbi:MAG: hypothetical protein OER88_12725, partial [Planctomycetota bacterium]|nr:hypothetical protein [Planctomycetota bacterium]